MSLVKMDWQELADGFAEGSAEGRNPGRAPRTKVGVMGAVGYSRGH